MNIEGTVLAGLPAAGIAALVILAAMGYFG